MPTCPRCSAPHDADARFCPACGAPLSDLPTSASGADAETLVASSSPPSLSFGSSQPAAAFAPGEMLAGRYRIVGLLGRGGMGEVYRADDLTLGIPVALKFLPAAAAADPGLVERFRAEVRSARQVSHPNVCRVYDIGEAEGRHFISMEYVDGEDLATLLRRIGRLPAPKAVEIARQVASGLAASHARGILHRDLKPANVMLDGQGQARITDFGLAVSGAAGETDLAGTPAYLAPERLADEPATEQSDLYALGLLLYELFTGQRPFMAKSLADWRRAHSEQTPSAPSTHSGEIDPAVERLVMQCLEKDPARRPRSAAQVLMALPGGDPLAAALAAGETPSPSLVAAAGGEGGLAPGRAWLALGGFVTLNLFSVGDYFRFYQKEDWHTAAGYVANFAEDNDLVLFNSNFVIISFDYYFQPYEKQYSLQVVKRGVPRDLFTNGILEPEMTESDVPALISLLREHSRVWLVYSHNDYTDPRGLIPQTLAAEMNLVRQRDFYGGQVQLYETRSPPPLGED